MYLGERSHSISAFVDDAIAESDDLPEVISSADKGAFAEVSEASEEDTIHYTMLVMHLSTATSGFLIVLQIADVRSQAISVYIIYAYYNSIFSCI